MTDAELAVLGLLFELGPSTGYRVVTAVGERGMPAWAGLSATSVYSSLRKLRRAGLVKATSNSKKYGRGPVGLLFSATALGRAAGRRQITAALVEAREQSPAFKVALAFSGMLRSERVATLLRQRTKRLRARIAEVESARRLQRHAGEPLGATLIFDYVLAGIKHEVVVAERLAKLTEGTHEAI